MHELHEPRGTTCPSVYDETRRRTDPEEARGRIADDECELRGVVVGIQGVQVRGAQRDCPASVIVSELAVRTGGSLTGRMMSAKGGVTDEATRVGDERERVVCCVRPVMRVVHARYRYPPA